MSILPTPQQIYQLALKKDNIRMKELCNEFSGIANTADENGITALHIAAQNGDIVSAMWLIEGYGAYANLSPQLYSLVRETPLSIACKSGNLEIAELLVYYGAKLDNNMLVASVENGNFKVFKWIFERYVYSVHSMDNLEWIKSNLNSENSLFYIAAIKGNLEICRYLYEQEPLRLTLDNSLSIDSVKTWHSIPQQIYQLAFLAFKTDSIRMQELYDQFLVLANTADGNGRTALHIAVQSGDVAFARLLIEGYGANVNLVVNVDRTLHRPRNMEELETLFYIQKFYRKFNEETPLSIACKSGNLEMAELLVHYGAKLNNNMLVDSVKNGHFKIFKLIFESKGYGIDNSVDFEWLVSNIHSENSLFHIAAIVGNLEIFRYLYTLPNLPLNSNEYFGFSLYQDGINYPLHLAAIEGHTAIVELIINENRLGRGAQDYITHANLQGQTILHLAAAHGRIAILNWLKDQNVDFNEVTDDDFITYDNEDYGPGDKLNQNALHVAIENGRLDSVKWFFENAINIDANLKDSYVHTPIAFAVIYKQLEILKYLYSQPTVDKKNVNSQGLSLFHLSVRLGVLDIVEFLLQNGENIEQETEEEIVILLSDIVQNAVEEDLDDSESDAEDEEGISIEIGRGQTALNIAAIYNKVKVFELLLKKGANIYKQDSNGNTILHLVAQQAAEGVGNTDLIYLLVERALINKKPINMKIENKDKQTVSDICSHISTIKEEAENKYKEGFTLLEHCFANIDAMLKKIILASKNFVEFNAGSNFLSFDSYIANLIYDFIGMEGGAKLLEQKESIKKLSSLDKIPYITQVLAREGLAIHDVPGDGNCFFHSIVPHLGGEFTHEQIRAGGIERLREISTEDGPLREGVIRHFREVENQDLRDVSDEQILAQYIERMSENTEWVDQIMIQAVADRFNLAITIYSSNSITMHTISPSFTEDTTNAPRAVNVLYTGNHYLSILPTDASLNAEAIATEENSGAEVLSEEVVSEDQDKQVEKKRKFIDDDHNQKHKFHRDEDDDAPEGGSSTESGLSNIGTVFLGLKNQATEESSQPQKKAASKEPVNNMSIVEMLQYTAQVSGGGDPTGSFYGVNCTNNHKQEAGDFSEILDNRASSNTTSLAEDFNKDTLSGVLISITSQTFSTHGFAE